jgi:hypothetical protein
LLEAYDRRQEVVLKSRRDGDKEVHHLWGTMGEGVCCQKVRLK